MKSALPRRQEFHALHRDEPLPVALARLGHIVLPIPPGRKLPAKEHIPGGKVQNLKNRPLTPSQVERIIREFPALGWAVLGVCRLDLDSETANHGRPTPITPTLRTGRGFQFWFRRPTGIPSNVRLTDQMELLVNGYGILPGHAHASGRVYEWVPHLSILDVPLAEVPEWAISLAQEAKGKARGGSGNPPRGSRGPQRGFRRAQGFPSDLRDRFNDDETARRLLDRHGIAYEESKPFLCILPGHKEATPSANVWRTPEGALVYRDFHRRDGRGSYRLADIFAATLTGTVRVLGRGEQVVWGIRMLTELGMLDLPDLGVNAPDQLTPSHRKVWEGLVLLARCRAAYGDRGPFPLGYDFVASWCGVSRTTAARAISEFKRSRHVGVTRRPQTTRLLFRFGVAAGVGRPSTHVMTMRRRPVRSWPGVLFAVEEAEWDGTGLSQGGWRKRLHSSY